MSNKEKLQDALSELKNSIDELEKALDILEKTLYTISINISNKQKAQLKLVKNEDD
jgi:seryl-tRNA synthetase